MFVFNLDECCSGKTKGRQQLYDGGKPVMIDVVSGDVMAVPDAHHVTSNRKLADGYVNKQKRSLLQMLGGAVCCTETALSLQDQVYLADIEDEASIQDRVYLSGGEFAAKSQGLEVPPSPISSGLGWRPNFSGIWNCYAIAGDVDGAMTDLGVAWAARVAFKVTGQGKGTFVHRIRHAGATFELDEHRRNYVLYKIGAGPHTVDDSVHTLSWDGSVLITRSQKLDESLPPATFKRYMVGDTMVWALRTHMGTSGAWLFRRQSEAAIGYTAKDGLVAPAAVMATTTEPAAPAPSQTLFGILAEKCESACVREKDGTLVDIDLASFFDAVVAYRVALSTLGAAVNMVLADFDPNYSFCRKLFDENPIERATGKSFFEAERKNPDNKPGNGSACRLKDPSGACKMQWLLRGLHFFGTMLKLMFEDDSKCANNAYAQTLQMYHGVFASTGIKASFLAMPGKDKVCMMEALSPKLAQDKERLSEAILREVPQAMMVFLPIVQRMITMQREAELWEDRKI